ncbi:MAG: DUF2807 domain-containing protein [Cytophagaceae bacterium]|nr:DUF2807 domain-containing protein [Cytophagaceae bacterium]
MQRKILLISFLAVFLTVLYSCGKKEDVVPEYDEYPYGDTDVSTIQMNGSPVITLCQDTCNRVIRQAKGMQVTKLGSYLIINGGGEIVLGCKNSLDISMSGGVVRNLDAPVRMKQLSISGQNGKVYLNKMTVDSSISAGISNNGDWYIAGATAYLTVSTTAHATFLGFDLKADSCVVSHNGLSDIQVNVSQKLTGGLYSLGNLFYKGYPPVVNIIKTGAGSVNEQ